jgi:fucose permease
MDINIWFPEALYFGNLSYSVVLMTTSLLFYHMTKTKSLEMNPKVSAIFAILLMIVSVCFVLTGISTYFVRLQELEEQNDQLSTLSQKLLNTEKNHYWTYFIFGLIYIGIEIAICIYIIKGSFISIRK